MANRFFRLNIFFVFLSVVQLSGCTSMQHASNVNSDETLIFFNTDAYVDPNNTNTWIVPIHGWVYEPQDSHWRLGLISQLFDAEYDLQRTDENRTLFDRRINVMLADNKRGKTIKLAIGDRTAFDGTAGGNRTATDRTAISLPSKPNGHFVVNVRLSEQEVQSLKNQNFLRYCAVLPLGDNRHICGSARLIPRHGFSVISDIDDTVKITQVTDHARMFENTFYKPYVAVAGMADLYQRWHNDGVPIHFVSSSPWHLYAELEYFLHENKFPESSMSLKYFRFKDSTFFNLFKSGLKTKPFQIKQILKQYPERKFVLIGDNGEQDPEVYAAMKREHPEQIEKIFIRNFTGEKATDARYSRLFGIASAQDFVLFDAPEELPILLR